MTNSIKRHYQAELSAYQSARKTGDRVRAWHHLERTHILGQRSFLLHIASHLHMLAYAVALRDGKEIAGQLVRLTLAPLGNVTGRLPHGNTGRSNISAFAPMDIPQDLQSKLGK
jgi:Protein of unknown function (DUF3703)